VRVSMAPSRERGGHNLFRAHPLTTSPLFVHHAPITTTTRELFACTSHTNIIAPPRDALSNAMTRAPPPAGLYDARSNYRRHTFHDGKHARDAIAAADRATVSALLVFYPSLFLARSSMESCDASHGIDSNET